jgi:hypothetical protein
MEHALAGELPEQGGLRGPQIVNRINGSRDYVVKLLVIGGRTNRGESGNSRDLHGKRVPGTEASIKSA